MGRRSPSPKKCRRRQQIALAPNGFDKLRRTVRTLSVPVEETRELTPAAISHLLDLQERIARRLSVSSVPDSEDEADPEDAK
jgi:hypothetical protein